MEINQEELSLYDPDITNLAGQHMTASQLSNDGHLLSGHGKCLEIMVRRRGLSTNYEDLSLST